MTDQRSLIRQSWQANAGAWTAAVREQRIESRRLVTDAAILAAIAGGLAARVLDLGCGEGWLCRALAERGSLCVGVDASEPLVEAARQLGGGRFEVMDYDDLVNDGHALGRFDVLVCNFALLDEHVEPLLGALRERLAPAGRLLIQTVHPWVACGGQPYLDGWRLETFAAFGDSFSTPMPWFFRTLESWLALLGASGWRLCRLREPRHPQSGQPCSLLLELQAACS
ncbi:class I SAM-dependent methyltransferase [Pseudomonas sp. ZM23]|uniref:Class I SAM-dependent methyltransferase n=1 Tax=Pseudomonas triclosanedens TaxID=2961893 RepID=A0ABY7A1L6_9PSED|nr:class I SAM-dependent methyltransferase [Pseudomonas triclosanedens]MCP8464465.1 class I SAM-dependent methyltransferase [Pseudomonas triclosanedens]MCP8471599.1 class I SAM-dependent methyltransferase [Pseudomonas triclosanedens]MCP8477589.1 class I SAM-dependent methyltransferase [Pseudomonas triclosanedens]WAI51051.1 class I SAM-dependent methyltransferase [Pseudomonas triclosanedens]